MRDHVSHIAYRASRITYRVSLNYRLLLSEGGSFLKRSVAFLLLISSMMDFIVSLHLSNSASDTKCCLCILAYLIVYSEKSFMRSDLFSVVKLFTITGFV